MCTGTHALHIVKHFFHFQQGVSSKELLNSLDTENLIFPFHLPHGFKETHNLFSFSAMLRKTLFFRSIAENENKAGI